MSELPEIIPILGIDHKIVEFSGSDPMNSGSYYGAIKSSEGIILVGSEFSHSRRQETLLHEVVHAIDHAFHDDDAGESLSEGQVKRISRGFHAVMRENPQVAEFLFGSEEI